MQSAMGRSMEKKRIAVSGKRQMTIPAEFFTELGIGKEVECYVRGGSLIIRPAPPEGGGEFAEQILADLLSQGFQGDELMARFKQINRALRPAAERLMAEADGIAAGKAPFEGMNQVFPGEE